MAPGGEVVAVDTAGYGAMEIHKSLSIIVPPGVHAGLSPSTGIPNNSVDFMLLFDNAFQPQ